MTTSSPVRTGAVVSSMVNVAVVDVLSPQSSVAVKVTVAAPVAPQRSLRDVKSLLHVTPPVICSSPFKTKESNSMSPLSNWNFTAR